METANAVFSQTYPYFEWIIVDDGSKDEDSLKELDKLEKMDKRIKVLEAKETGICTVREQLYSECFDELIRQVTINCLERGILMMLVKTEYENQIKTYQNLYQSSIAYGIRSYLIIEEEKKRMNDENEQMEEECDELSSDIEALKKEIQNYVKHKTAPYKYPRIVEFKDELPKTVSGKIIRHLL